MGSARWFCFAILVLGGCEKRSPAEAPRWTAPKWDAPRDAEEAYRSLLADLAQESFPEDEPTETFVVHREPKPVYPRHREVSNSVMWRRLKREMPSLRRDTYDDFWGRNEKPTLRLSVTAAGKCKVRHIRSTELEESYAAAKSVHEFWEQFYARYPKSCLLGLSAMGFGRDGRQGLVYADFDGWYAAYYVVEKIGSRWRITEEWTHKWI